MISRKITHSLLIGLLVVQSFPGFALMPSRRCKPVLPITHFTPEEAQAMIENIRARMLIAQENGDTQEVQRLLGELQQVIERAREASAAESRSSRSTRTRNAKQSVAPIISSYNHDEGHPWLEVITGGMLVGLMLGISVPLVVLTWKMMFDMLKQK